MSRRTFQVISVGAVVLAVVGLLKLAPVAGQAAADKSGTTPSTEGATKAGPAPKTPWGDPDLQGIWTNDYETPLQRPSKYANKPEFTDEERAVLDKQRAGIIGADRRNSRGSEQDVGGAYNAAIFLSHKHLGRRTSLIIDPPDGRIPAFTPEATKRREALRQFQLA